MTPLWRKAPLLLLRFPGLLIPVAAAVAVLALGSASSPLFVASAAGASLDREFAQLDAATIGMEMGLYGVAAPQPLGQADERIREAAQRIPRMGEPTLTLAGPDMDVFGLQGDTRLSVLYRTGALDHLVVVAQDDDRDGVWIAQRAAERMGLEAGDDAEVRWGDRRMSVPVQGIYRDLADVLSTAYWAAPDPLPADDPVVRYWSRLSEQIVRPTPTGPAVQPPFLLVDEDTFSAMTTQLVYPSEISWTFPYDTSEPNLAEVQATVPALNVLEGRVNDPLNPLGEAVRALHLYSSRTGVHSFIPGVADRVASGIAALSAPVRALSLAAQGLALLVVAVAAAFGAQRRAVEVRLLVVQGVSPALLGGRAALEAVVPALLGAAAGWAGAVALIRAIGPSADLGPTVVGSALSRTLIVTIVPILVVGIVTMFIARAQAAQGSSRLRGIAARAPWEALVLVLAGAAYYQVVTRPPVSGDAAGGFDGLVLLFPLLLVAGGAGLVARGLARLLPRLRGSGTAGGSAAGYLARRRLAAAPGSALLLVAASSLAIGVLVYAGTAAATTDASLQLKAAVNVGSDVAVDVGRDPTLSLPFPSTRVGHQQAELLGGSAGGVDVDVLAIDTATFASAATWSGHFSASPLQTLLAGLEADAGERLPVIAVGGGLPNQGTLATSRSQLPVEVSGRARAFPGMSADRPMVVVSAQRLVDAVAATGSTTDERLFLEGTQWIRGETAAIVSALGDLGVLEESITTVEALRSRPDLLARSWTLGYLQAVGAVAGLLAFIGTLLYLSARQASREVAYVLARRMGLSARSHRRSVAVELAGMLGVATVAGGLLALFAARLLLGQLDPLPTLAPVPLLAWPWSLLGGLAVAMLVACVLGAAVVQRAADRARVSEVLRLAA